MKNGVSRGINITVPNSTGAAIVAGQAVRIGSLFGYAIDAAAIGADVVLVTEGIIDAAALAADVVAVGDKLNINTTTGELQKATANLDGVATAVEVKVASDTTVKAKLTPV